MNLKTHAYTVGVMLLVAALFYLLAFKPFQYLLILGMVAFLYYIIYISVQMILEDW